MSFLRLTVISLRPHFIVGEPPSSTIADAKECRIADRWRCSYNFVSINCSMTSGSPIMHSFRSHPGGQVVGDFKEYPIRQKPASFSLERVMEQMMTKN